MSSSQSDNTGPHSGQHIDPARNASDAGYRLFIDAISERPEASAAGQQDSPLYKTMVDGVTDYALVMLDTAGIVLTWNTGAERINGYTADEIIGCDYALFFTREDVMRLTPQHQLEIAAETGRMENECWRVRQNGSFYWARVVMTALRDEHERLIGYAKVTHDMTDRRRVEEGIRRSEECLRLLIDGVRDYAIIMLDRDGRVDSWNSGAFRIQGYESYEIIGQDYERFYTPEQIDAGLPAECLRRAAIDGQCREEGWRVRRDGSQFWSSVVISALRDDRGNLRGHALVARDLSERRDELTGLQLEYRLLAERLKERSAALAAETSLRKLLEAELLVEHQRCQSLVEQLLVTQTAGAGKTSASRSQHAP
jgi:PAS domain S-box-containing protein